MLLAMGIRLTKLLRQTNLTGDPGGVQPRIDIRLTENVPGRERLTEDGQLRIKELIGG